MYIIEDVNNKVGQHELKNDRWSEMGVGVKRCKLPYGDYVRMPPVSVDTKRDIYELAMDIDQEHERFKRELVGARESGCRLVILVENEDGVCDLRGLVGWEEPDEHLAMRIRRSGNKKARRISGMRLAKACLTMQERYGVEFRFCSPQEAAERVLEILDGGEGGEPKE